MKMVGKNGMTQKKWEKGEDDEEEEEFVCITFPLNVFAFGIKWNKYVCDMRSHTMNGTDIAKVKVCMQQKGEFK